VGFLPSLWPFVISVFVSVHTLRYLGGGAGGVFVPDFGEVVVFVGILLCSALRYVVICPDSCRYGIAIASIFWVCGGEVLASGICIEKKDSWMLSVLGENLTIATKH